MTFWWDLTLALAAFGLALSLRPWRGVGRDGPPGLWLAWLLAMAVFWSADRLAAMPITQPLSGACLLMLMMGWPMAMLALLPVAALAAPTSAAPSCCTVWSGWVSCQPRWRC